MIVFFMISGYIILHVINYETPLEFIVKRIFRIYPLLIVAILLQVALAYYIHDTVTPIKTIMIQMSLMGDFFNTPEALGGVEWTLRLEVIFYLFMAVICFMKINNKGYTLLLIFVLITLFLSYISPILPNTGWSLGYFNIYFPFLLLGASIYLYESKKINLLAITLFTVYIFQNYFSMIYLYQNSWLITNFAIVGYMVFMFMWLIREKLNSAMLNTIALKISILTYSVYLFHDYLWEYINSIILKVNIHNQIAILPILFLLCIFMNRFIERPMNRLGKNIIKKWKD
ncbi:acyltransferase [Francisella philomiragia]|uniref:acyltransferase family protein n=1 Tax=Francisella philomiragia TaxID=28110 RepID=UPI0019055360|nr:acyltransferase [Francisella philomiragia]MBK2092375.1 acyltransferase [Francisella philomiragia]